MRLGILAAALLGMIGMAGCVAEVEEGPAYVGGPVVYDSWYWGGYYDGPYWVYRDHDGHWFHEARAEHESRARIGHFEGGRAGGHVAEHRAVEHRAEGGHAGGHEGGGHGEEGRGR